MSKKEQILLLWGLTISVSILLMLYSPLGSPDMYHRGDYIALNQGVSFSDKIQNAPKFRNSNQMYKNEISTLTVNVEVTDYKIDTQCDNKFEIYAVDPTVGNEIHKYTNRSKPRFTASTFSNGRNKNIPTYAKNQQNSNPIVEGSSLGRSLGGRIINRSTAGGSIDGGVNIISAYGFKSSTSNNNYNPKVLGFAAISNDISIDIHTNNYLAANDAMQKASNPGDDPLEEPIPVGDGWWLLLIFAVVYTKLKTI